MSLELLHPALAIHQVSHVDPGYRHYCDIVLIVEVAPLQEESRHAAESMTRYRMLIFHLGHATGIFDSPRRAS